jgi:hypothetical protein
MAVDKSGKRTQWKGTWKAVRTDTNRIKKKEMLLWYKRNLPPIAYYIHGFL